jgi:hypothetical protein
MANTLKKLSPNWIAREVLFRVAAQTAVAGCVNRRYSSEYTSKTPRIGETIRVRKPTILRAVDGPDVTGLIQDFTETSVDVTMDQYISVPIELDDIEHALTLSPEEARKEFVPAMADALVNELDVRVSNFLATLFPNVVGVAGSTPDDFDAVAAAAEVLDRFGAPRGPGSRHLIIDPKANRFLGSTFQAGFNPANLQSDTFRDGLVTRAAGFDVYMDRNIAAYQDQALTGIVEVNGAGQTGSSLIATLTGTEGFNKGAVINIEGVNSVDRLSGQDTGELQDFVIQSTVQGIAGNITLSIFPAIVITGPYATVSASPADNADITLRTAGPVVATPEFSRQNLALHTDAAGIVSVPLPKFNGLDICESVNYMGYSMRLMRDVDVMTTQAVARMDMFFGMAGFYKRMGVRVLG